MGLYYLGPVDGNNYANVEALLEEAKNAEGSVIIHIKTKKGKGYELAEKFPDLYHGISPDKDVVSCDGEPLSYDSFSLKMGEHLTSLADEDGKIVAITAAMSGGTGLDSFEKKHKDRFFDVGIAEEHAVTFAAGLAANGMKPVFACYSTFLQRGYDQMIHDVALQNLPVVFCIDRAGLNAPDGATHHGIFDVAFMSEIPNIKIYTPVTYKGLYASINSALKDNCPAAVRYPNGSENADIISEFYNSDNDYSDIGIKTDFDKNKDIDVLFITHGRYTAEVIAAKKELDRSGISSGIVLCEMIKPYENIADLISDVIKSSKPKACIFAEEEIRAGGFSMMLSGALRDMGALDGIKYGIIATDSKNSLFCNLNLSKKKSII